VESEPNFALEALRELIVELPVRTLAARTIMGRAGVI
jgi:hypothetical protein